MYSVRSILVGAFIAAVTADSSGLNLTGTIQGCSQTNCPDDGNCTILGHSYTQVGVTNFTSSLATEPFNWAIAGNIEANAYYKATFLGTPKNFSFGSDWLSTCILIWSFQDSITLPSQDRNHSSGTCGDALGDGCVAAMTKQATEVVKKHNVNGTSLDDVCQTLIDEFNDKEVAQECRTSNLTRWKYILGEPIRGGDKVMDFDGDDDDDDEDEGPPIISKNENTTCLPSSPGSNQLRLFSTSDVGTTNDTDPLEGYFSMTPIMTVFFGNNSINQTHLEAPEVHLSCVKPTGYSKDELEFMNDTQASNGTNGDDEGNSTMGGGARTGAANALQLTMLSILTVASIVFSI